MDATMNFVDPTAARNDIFEQTLHSLETQRSQAATTNEAHRIDREIRKLKRCHRLSWFKQTAHW
jgi:hypothetical protein